VTVNGRTQKYEQISQVLEVNQVFLHEFDFRVGSPYDPEHPYLLTTEFDEKGYEIAVWLDVHDKNIYAGTITIRFCGFYGELHWSEPTCG